MPKREAINKNEIFYKKIREPEDDCYINKVVNNRPRSDHVISRPNKKFYIPRHLFRNNYNVRIP